MEKTIFGKVWKKDDMEKVIRMIESDLLFENENYVEDIVKESRCLTVKFIEIETEQEEWNLLTIAIMPNGSQNEKDLWDSNGSGTKEEIKLFFDEEIKPLLEDIVIWE